MGIIYIVAHPAYHRYWRSIAIEVTTWSASHDQGGFEALSKNRFLERLGILRHTLKEDLLLFFLPWFTAYYLELFFCRNYGDGVSGIWGVIWEVIKHPQKLFSLPLQRMIGMPLFVIGLTIMIVGQITLWQNYSGFLVIKKGHQLITNGIYRFTRNPIYLGSILVFAGLPVYAASVYGFLAMLAMIPIILFRIQMEEKMLAEHFGDEYETYRRNTKRLIPFLY
jgi:protein-S-isoprenylcysteine O-methyltransferase Ste14